MGTMDHLPTLSLGSCCDSARINNNPISVVRSVCDFPSYRHKVASHLLDLALIQTAS
jgi:hypothetical protein